MYVPWVINVMYLSKLIHSSFFRIQYRKVMYPRNGDILDLPLEAWANETSHDR